MQASNFHGADKLKDAADLRAGANPKPGSDNGARRQSHAPAARARAPARAPPPPAAAASTIPTCAPHEPTFA